MVTKPFVLSVGVFISNDEGRVLLLRRAECCGHFRGLWETPGGKAEPAESLDSVLQREVQEETGLVVEIDGVCGASEFELPHLRVCALYLRGHWMSGEVRLSEEHQEYVWVRPEEFQERPLAPALADMLERVDLRGMFTPSEPRR